MTAADNANTALGRVECGISARPFPGEIDSGDMHLLASRPNGMLVAVVDGLGHGVDAAAAAHAAVDCLRQEPHQPPADLVRQCHSALKNTRGAVLSLAIIDMERDQLTWLGVGNVEGTLVRADPIAQPRRETLLHRGGVVGYQLPPLRINTLPIASGDTLIFATDGIRSSFLLESPIDWRPQELADHIVDRHGKETDDALVVVVQYVRSISR